MRRSLLITACLLVAPLAGCTICPSPYDCDYGFYGGSWQRHEPSQGRVGSAFNNAGSPVNPAVEESIEVPGEPTPSEIPGPLQPGVGEGI